MHILSLKTSQTSGVAKQAKPTWSCTMLNYSHKFRSPSQRPNQIARPRIVGLFQANEFAKVIVVEASAGYGKSTAVAEYLPYAAAVTSWYSIEWNSLSSFQLLKNLVGAIQANAPSFGQNIAFMFTDLPQDLITSEKQLIDLEWVKKTIVPAFITELEIFASKILVVLDNYHRVQDEYLDDLFSYLIEHTPDNIRFILTSRHQLNWSLRKQWIDKSLLAAVSENTLALTLQECLLLASKWGLSLDQEHLQQILKITNGWPILLTTLFRDHTSTQMSSLLGSYVQPLQIIHTVLKGELSKEENPRVLSFLYQTSILNELETRVCNHVLNISDATTLLFHPSTSYFLEQITTPTKIIFRHSHDIIRDFLESELERNYSKEEIEMLYMRLAEFYQAEEQWGEAIAIYCQRQQFTMAISLLREQAPFLISASDLMTLEQWLNYFPTEWLEKDPSLLINRGFVLMHQRSPIAEDYLLKAQSLFIQQNNPSGVVRAESELGWFYGFKGHYDEAFQILKSTLTKAMFSLRLTAHVLHYLLIVCQGSDHFEEGINYGQQASMLLRQISSPESHVALARLLRYLSITYSSLGQPQKALECLQEAHQIVKALNLGSWSIAWINNQMATVYQALGQLSEAHQCLDEADELLSKYRDLGIQTNLLQYTLITRGHLYREQYKYELAEVLYRKAERGNPNGVFLALRLVQPGYELQALDLAKRSWNRHKTSSSPVTTAKYMGMLGLAHLNLQQYDQAQPYLEEANKILYKHRAIIDTITLRMYLAKLYYELKDFQSGRNYLEYVLHEMSQRGYYGLDWWHPWIIGELCAKAIEEGIELAFVKDLILKRLTKEHVYPLLPLLSNKNTTTRETASEILSALGDVLRYHAYTLLNEYSNDSYKQLIYQWLQSNWLTPEGLLRLKQSLSWGKLVAFLLWLKHGGSPKEVAYFLTHYENSKNRQEAIRTQLKEAWFDLKTKGGVQVKENSFHEFYQWAIREQVIVPRFSESIDYH